MAAGSTYTPLATYTAPSNVTSYTFSSIPTSYTDLILIGSFTQSNASDLLTFQVGNGSVDTGSNYSITYILGNGSSATSGRFSSQTSGFITRNLGGTTTQANCVMSLQNYSNTTTYKTMLVRSNQADSSYPGAEANVNLWRSTAAINTLKIAPTAGTINTGSTFTIYGIQAA